jgi:hypothetical protein
MLSASLARALAARGIHYGWFMVALTMGYLLCSSATLTRSGPWMCSATSDSVAESPYTTFTFQKIGAPNFRTSRTFFRKAVGCIHSPHGTYATSLRATF